MDYDADLLVLGSGPAGEKAAAQAAYFGKRVVVVEREALPGGAAVHTGTLPSKSFRESARDLRRRRVVDPRQAMQVLTTHKDAVRLREVERIRANLDRHGVTVVTGAGRLLDPHTVEVTDIGGHRISAEYILVATGSRAYRPQNIDFSDTAIDDSDSILRLDCLPERMVVIGGGVIGSEYASFFAELGVAVTIVDARPRLMPWLDNEISCRLEAALEDNGVTLLLGRKWESIERDGRCIVTTFEDGAPPVLAERVMFASGRTGSSRSLGLEQLGVEIDHRDYIKVDAAFRTSVPSILAAGDVIGAPALASTSMEQGRVAVCRAFGFEYKQEVSDLIPTGIYTIPEVASVGLREDDLAERGIDGVVGHASYAQNPRGRLVNDTQGGVKLVFDRESRMLLGVHLIGEMATELVHIGHMVIALGGTVETFIDGVFNYPTLAESYKYAAYDALGRWNSQ